MTSADSLTLQHNRILIYLQILAAISVAIYAGQFFEPFRVSFGIWVFPVNNLVLGFGLGILGLTFLRRKLKDIELRIIKIKK